MENSVKINEAALSVLKTNRVAVFIVAYNASNHIEKVLNRIPKSVAENLSEVFLIDDSSIDDTALVASKAAWPSNYAPLKVFKTPFNQGYGGNQKIGFNYTIQKSFDIVILLHGDGQYAPEALPLILAQYAENVDAVFGSRFIKAGNPLAGGMPLYKFVGNRILTALQNFIMNGSLSEWHSGYRSYRISLLKRIPFSCNSNDFDFDAEIIIQTLGIGGVIKEVPIPTFYGDEICHVNGIKYALQCVKNVMQYRIMQVELFYDPRFDLEEAKSIKSFPKKQAKTSIDYFIKTTRFHASSKILKITSDFGQSNTAELDLSECSDSSTANLDFHKFMSMSYDTIFALNVFQNQSSPELSLEKVAGCLKINGRLYASCANVAYLPVRLMLSLGFFNYGRRGILDKSHKRLFTKSSFKRFLSQGGFEVEGVYGFGPPIVDKVGAGKVLRVIDRLSYLLAKFWPSLFAFEILFVAKKRVDIHWLLEKTTNPD